MDGCGKADTAYSLQLAFAYVPPPSFHSLIPFVSQENAKRNGEASCKEYEASICSPFRNTKMLKFRVVHRYIATGSYRTCCVWSIEY